MEEEKKSILGKANFIPKLKSFGVQCMRVWYVLRKPTMDEFKATSKISALGILVLGAGGFAISDIIKLVGNLF